MSSRRIATLLLALAVAGCENAAERSDEPVEQTQPQPQQPQEQLEAELQQLVRGEHAGALADGESWFSPQTAHVLKSATIDSAGHAVVDFADLRPLIGNASSSAGSTILLNDLNTAVFSIPQIQSAEYRMEGSCDLFGEWLQYGCLRITRTEYEQQREGQ